MMNGRSVFVHSAATVAAAQKSTAASDKINTACIGLGSRGFGTFRQWLKMPDFNVVRQSISMTDTSRRSTRPEEPASLPARTTAPSSIARGHRVLSAASSAIRSFSVV